MDPWAPINVFRYRSYFGAWQMPICTNLGVFQPKSRRCQEIYFSLFDNKPGFEVEIMANKKKIGVVLSGCGFLDGSEVQEAVLTLLALDERGAQYQVFAPNLSVSEVDHLSGRETGQKRNVLSESARIARGKISDIADAKVSDYAAWIFPGGYGAAKILSDFATNAENPKVMPNVSRIIHGALEAKMPIGACCIAPATLAAATKGRTPPLTLTIGSDQATAAAIEKMGSKHVACEVRGIVSDDENKVVTTPAYMLDTRISEVAQGIKAMVSQVLEWVK